MTITCNFVNLIVSAEYIFDKKRGCNLVHFTRANLEGIREPSLANPTQRWVLKGNWISGCVHLSFFASFEANKT